MKTTNKKKENDGPDLAFFAFLSSKLCFTAMSVARAVFVVFVGVVATCLAALPCTAQQPIAISENFSSQLSFMGLKQEWYVDYDAQLRATIDSASGLRSVQINRTLYNINVAAQHCIVSQLKDGMQPMWAWLKTANYSGRCGFGEGRRYDAIIDRNTQYSLCAARPNGQTEYLPLQFLVQQESSQTQFLFYDYFPLAPGRGNFTVPAVPGGDGVALK